MNIPGFTTKALEGFHRAINDALAKDDATPHGQDKPYGAREYPDWRQTSDEIEAELTTRNVPFTPIQW